VATMFKGSITALVTPMRDGKVDEKALVELLEWQIGEGTYGVVPVGTTGESPTLSHEEHKRVVSLTVEVVAGRIPVIAGAGSNSTAEAIDFVRHAEAAGADGVLVVTPYYNKPSQEGLYRHYMAIDAATALPIVIYNIPPRSVVDMSIETMARLYEDGKNIVGVKDATAKIDRVSLQRHAMGAAFIQLSGEDGTALGYMAHGGHGCISVTSNVAPRLCAEFQRACLAGDYAAALKLQDRLMPLHRAMFLEPSPAGAKYALSLLNRCANELRLPMVPLTPAAQAEVRAAMSHAGLI